MALLIAYLLGTLGISFLCSLLESVLMSTPLSFITMKKEQGYKPAEKFSNSNRTRTGHWLQSCH